MRAKMKTTSPTASKPVDGTVGTSAKKYLKLYILGPFFKLWEAIFELLNPVLMSIIVSRGLSYSDTGVVNGADWRVIGLCAGGMLIMAILGFSSTLVCQYMSSIASQGTGTDLRNRLFKHALKLSPSDLNKYGLGEVTNLITNDTNQIQSGAANLIRLAFRAPFLVIGAIIASIILDWRSGLIFLGIAILLFAFLFTILPKTAREYGRVQKRIDTLSQQADDSLQGARVIRAFNREDYEVKKFKKESQGYMDDSLRIAKLTSITNPITTVIINVAIVILVALGGLVGLYNPDATTQMIADENGRIIALVNYLNQILQAVTVVTNIIIVFNRSLSSIRRCNAFLALAPSMKDEGTRTNISTPRGAPLYQLSNCSLSYSDSEMPALSGVDLTIRKGERIGIIGGTGAGKTTLLNLLLRFYDPTRGTIDYRGAPLSQYSLDGLYSEIGYVPQRPQVFKGTVRTNLLLANPKADQQDMEAALRLALCDFILDSPEGLERPIDEGAKDLSGGQRQRLAIAMALVRHPQIIILDDSFSALDFLSERRLRDNLRSLGPALTQIIVSERVSSLQGCDRIVVLDEGRVESIGSPTDLYGRSPIYTRICDVQKGVAR